MFHTSFFLLVLAVVWGKATGFDGIMTITEGQRVAETRASYDTLQEGMLFDGHHSGYEVQLNRFSAPLQANGMPSDFVSNMTVYDVGQAGAHPGRARQRVPRVQRRRLLPAGLRLGAAHGGAQPGRRGGQRHATSR